MPRILCTADVHVGDKTIVTGNISRARLPVYKSLCKELVSIARANGCTAIIISGDLIDQKNKFPMEVYLAVLEFLQEADKWGVKVIWVRGNHETPNFETPERTLMGLFENHAKIFLSPGSIQIENTTLVFIPWYHPDKYREYVDKAVKAVKDKGLRSKGKKAVLFTHIGLAEGATSPSNFHPPSSLSVKDLHPSEWDLVLIGDYHAAQQLLPNVAYMGAPIPHTFGDFDIKGVWLLDTEDLRCTAYPTSCAPQFEQWEIKDGDTSLPDYNKNNYNRIHTTPMLKEIVRGLYPDADIRTILTTTEVVTANTSRISLDSSKSYNSLVDRFVDYKRSELPEELKTLGKELIKEFISSEK